MPTYTVHLKNRYRLSRDVFVLRFERPPEFTFDPGQYIRFHRGGTLRDYTIISSSEASGLEICVRHLADGGFTPELITAPMGRPFSMEGPLGYFRFQSAPQEAVFLATGTGIAPFVAFVRAGVRGFTLLHGAPTVDMLLFREELCAAAGNYQACLSALADTATALRPHWQFPGRVTEQLRTMPPRPCHFYLCGGRAMIRDAVGIIDERFEGAPVFMETFY